MGFCPVGFCPRTLMDTISCGAAVMGIVEEGCSWSLLRTRSEKAAHAFCQPAPTGLKTMVSLPATSSTISQSGSSEVLLEEESVGRSGAHFTKTVRARI